MVEEFNLLVIGRTIAGAMRFQRSFKILPGVRINLSKSGIGVSAGPRGLKVGIDGRGRKFVNAGIPGTGLSTREYLKPAPTPASSHALPAARPAARIEERAPERPLVGRPGIWILALGLVAGIGIALVPSKPDQPALLPSSVAPFTRPTPGPTPEEAAITIARRVLSREHPAYADARITPDRFDPVTRTASGFNVKLQYQTKAGALLLYSCKVAQQDGTCSTRAANAPAPALGAASGLHVGPRGGVYHYSASGKKVYQRKRR